MTDLLVGVGSGSLAGLVHVLSGPDHLAAVAPLAVEGRERKWLAGLVWGFGHTAGVVLVGGLFLLLRGILPPIESISAWGERVVGAALIAIGIWGFYRAREIAIEGHRHGAGAHAHARLGRGHANGHRHVQPGHVGAAFAMGMLHGLAGTSHVLGVVPALALPTRQAGLVYLASFGGATVIGMTAFSGLVGFAAVGATRAGSLRFYRALLVGAAAMACGVGGYWLIG